VTSYEFTLRLNREVADDELDALYAAGCDDAAIETGPLGAVADFDREAPSLAHAITSAARDIDKVPGLRAVGVQCDSMVNLQDIADRVGVSREAVRLWAAGKRGPGGFPKPILITTGGEQVWDWGQVAPWVDNYTRKQARSYWTLHRVRADLRDAIETLRIFNAADRVLAARDALRSEPDDDVRHELEQLLADA
jgi:hypothetical protein